MIGLVWLAAFFALFWLFMHLLTNGASVWLVSATVVLLLLCPFAGIDAAIRERTDGEGLFSLVRGRAVGRRARLGRRGRRRR